MKPITPFHRAVEALQPGATGSQIAALLDNRISRHLALNWKAGRSHAAPWALELLATKIHAHASSLQSIGDQTLAVPERPGLKAGARNLAAYLARR